MFGAKFVDLVYPDNPSPQRLAAGQVLKSRNVSTEVNTVFENVVVRAESDRHGQAQRHAVGARRRCSRSGGADRQATTDANQVLLQLNPRSDTIRADWQALKGFNDAYSGAAQDILTVLNAASTTSATITSHAKQLDALLLATIGLSNSGISLLAPNQANLIKAINVLEPTTNLLYKYSPEYTCLLMGAKTMLDTGGYRSARRQRPNARARRGLALGDDPYHYPDNLPVIGAKGGPGGKPGCGSLPDVAKNWPVRNLVTNTGFGTGMDWRPNPGIGFPAWANYLPGHPCGARTAEHPQPLRRPCAGADPVSGRPGVRRGPVRAGRHAAVAGAAAGAAADGATGSRADTRVRTLRRPGARADAADPATADSASAGGRPIALITDRRNHRP